MVRQIHIGSRTSLLPEDIAFFEAIGNYTKIHLQSNKYLLSSTTLGIIEERAKSTGLFIRANRGTLINTNFIRKIDCDNVLMINEITIKMSRRKKTEILQFLNVTTL